MKSAADIHKVYSPAAGASAGDEETQVSGQRPLDLHDLRRFGDRRDVGGSPQVVQFPEHLLRDLPGRLLIVWDGLRSHRSRMVWDFVREQYGRLWVEFLLIQVMQRV